MYKVVIIDDESIIVEGLTRIVPWERYNCQVVGSASDGISGGNIIREHKPDIVLTDIRMPGMDGLSMLAGLKSEFPDLQITVLTGYRDFSYAQQAIHIGVTRFLLKPSKMNELEEALETMRANLDKLEKTQPPEEQNAQALNHNDVASSFIVRQAVAYIEEHCTEKITLSDVADKCYVSQWHLSKLLNRHANQTFYDLINTFRITRAKALLHDPSLRISEISEQVGYIDTAHFSRVFKKLEGVSANEYRNSGIEE